MNQLLKRICVGLCVLSLFSLLGCSKENPIEETNKEEAEEVKMIANDRYVEPLNPTTAQIKAYNLLSEAVEKNDPQEEAAQVAVSFAYDFFTLSNKDSYEDMGGLQFIPSDQIARFEAYAQAYYYGNYPTIVNEYGESSLPEVSEVSVDDVTEEVFTYNGEEAYGYLVTLTLSYRDTKLDDEALKKEMVVSVVELNDYDYDRNIDYDSSTVFEGERHDAYRVLAVE